MLRKTLRCGAFLTGTALVLAVLPASAGDKKGDKGRSLSGVWAQQGGEVKIEFSDKNVLKISPHGNDDILVVLCSYTADKNMLVKAKITELDGKAKDKAKEIIPVGLEFSFTWEIKGDVATLDDIKGKNADPLKSHLEGKYDAKK
jgi:hypothetical protein